MHAPPYVHANYRIVHNSSCTSEVARAHVACMFKAEQGLPMSRQRQHPHSETFREGRTQSMRCALSCMLCASWYTLPTSTRNAAIRHETLSGDPETYNCSGPVGARGPSSCTLALQLMLVSLARSELKTRFTTKLVLEYFVPRCRG